MAKFTVIHRPLTHNGKPLKVGEHLELSPEDGAALASRGRVKAYGTKTSDEPSPSAADAAPPSPAKR